MFTHGTLARSYAEVVKASRPAHAEIPRLVTAALVGGCEEWTDISSVGSCSWPDDEASRHDEAEPLKQPTLLRAPYPEQEDLWDGYIVDTRAERVLRFSSKRYSRSRLLDHKVDSGILKLGEKPWKVRLDCGFHCRCCCSCQATLTRAKKKKRISWKREAKEAESLS